MRIMSNILRNSEECYSYHQILQAVIVKWEIINNRELVSQTSEQVVSAGYIKNFEIKSKKTSSWNLIRI